MNTYLSFEGVSGYSESELIKLFEEHPQITRVEKIIVETEKNTADADVEHSTTPATPAVEKLLRGYSDGLNSHDTISPAALKVAEETLTEYLGLVAPLLVESAAKKTKHVGDLFLLLSEELEVDERDLFLSTVRGLDLAAL